MNCLRQLNWSDLTLDDNVDILGRYEPKVNSLDNSHWRPQYQT
jgi:hypothetical protein